MFINYEGYRFLQKNFKFRRELIVRENYVDYKERNELGLFVVEFYYSWYVVYVWFLDYVVKNFGGLFFGIG